MKSVKEKAEELFDFPYIQDTFEDGANYVLEQIEQYCKEHIVCNSNIEHIIEQLKK